MLKFSSVVLLLSITLAACNAAFLIPIYIRGVGDVCGESSCSALIETSEGRVLAVPIPVFGAIAYGLAWALAVRWLIADAEGKRRAGRLLWTANISIAVISAGLYIYANKVLHTHCPFCFANCLLAVVAALFTNIICQSRNAISLSQRLVRPLVFAGGVLLIGSAVAGSVWPGKTLAAVAYEGVVKDQSLVRQLFDRTASIHGKADSKVKIVIFSDPVCPACLKLVPWVISKADSDHLWVSYRFYPLRNIHKQAFNMSVLEAWAAEHGKFDEVRRLIETCDGYPRYVFDNLKGVGLSEKEALQAIVSAQKGTGKYPEMIQEDVNLADRIGLTGTPFFVIVEDGKPTRWFLGSAILKFFEALENHPVQFP